MGDSGEEFTWEVSANGDEEHPFENAQQTGSPVNWTTTGMLSFGTGLRQSTTKSDQGEARVQIPGQVDCTPNN